MISSQRPKTKEESGKDGEFHRDRNIQKFWWEKRELSFFEGLAYSKNLLGFKGFEHVVYSEIFKIFEYSKSNKNSLFFNELAAKTGVIATLVFKKFEELITYLLYINLPKRACGRCSRGF